jgi:nicotinate-nucleotide adenylyltransferase
MPLLCFGGSFNPIHYGHLICARAVAEARGFDGVVLIPCSRPPHKPDAVLASAKDRLAMCRLAIEGACGWSVDDLEIVRGGPSYTINTVRELRQRGWGEVHWLIGADMVAGLPKWHEAANLLREVSFVVMGRPGWPLDWSGVPPEYRRLEGEVVSAPMIEITATEIRRRVAAGRGIEFLTPPGVCEYIREKGLYR